MWHTLKHDFHNISLIKLTSTRLHKVVSFIVKDVRLRLIFSNQETKYK